MPFTPGISRSTNNTWGLFSGGNSFNCSRQLLPLGAVKIISRSSKFSTFLIKVFLFTRLSSTTATFILIFFLNNKDQLFRKRRQYLNFIIFNQPSWLSS